MGVFATVFFFFSSPCVGVTVTKRILFEFKLLKKAVSSRISNAE